MNFNQVRGLKRPAGNGRPVRRPLLASRFPVLWARMRKYLQFSYLFLCIPFLYSQALGKPLPSGDPILESQSAEIPASDTELSPESPPETAEIDVFLKTLPLDIASSDYYALLSWVRSLGLDATGSADDLRSRLYGHYSVSAPPSAKAAAKTVIIESADKTDYLSAKGDGDSIIRFSGGVSITMKDDASGESHLIRADEIIYNKDSNLMSARGHIVYERKKAGGSDFFLGELMEIDLDEWSGLFLDGKSKSGAQSETKLTFEAKDIVRRGESVLEFKDGIITNGDKPEKYFSIRASRIWILGGNEWAIFNATLSVGELPVLYLPFFYYPGEEIVFHPVFGSRDREGRFVQTTTYFLGEKPEKKESISLFKLTEGSKGYAKRIDGVFLRTTKDKKESKTSDVIKMFLDIYTNLGAYSGIQANITTLKPFQSIDAYLGIGYSRSIFPLGTTTFSPFVMEHSLQSIWNETNLFGVILPFRFSFNLASRFSLGPVSVSFALPFFGDTWFDRDFKQRTEDMEWLQFMKKKETGVVPSKVTTFTDKIDIQATVPVSAISPWITGLSLSRLSSSLLWISKASVAPTDPAQLLFYRNNPCADFFLPDTFSLVDSALSIGGTLFEYPFAVKSKEKPDALKASAPAGENAGPAVKSGSDETLPELMAPWFVPEQPPASAETITEPTPDFIVPGILSPETAKVRNLFAMKLFWQATPSLKIDRRFNTAAWLTPDLLNWQALYETRSGNISGSMTLNASLLDSLAKLTAVVNASSRGQDRPIVLSDTAYVSQTLLDTWKRQDAQARADKISGTLGLSSSPLQDFWFFAPTTLSWNLEMPLYDYTFDSIKQNVPVFKTQTFEWTQERIKTHNLSTTLAIRPFGFDQSLALKVALPPLLPSYGLNLALRFPFSIAVTSSTSFAKKTAESDFSWEPLNVSLTGGKTPFPVSTNTIAYSITDKRLNSLVNKLVWDGLSAEIVSKYMPAYTFSLGKGWLVGTDSEFRASDMTIAFNKQWTPLPLWKNRISSAFSINSDIKQSFLRITDSSMGFNTNLTFKIFEFLDISFVSNSRNSSSWRYYKDWFQLPEPFASVAAVNPFLDILKGFDIFNPDKSNRQESLFKLKSLTVKAVHYMSDWDLTFDFTAQPFLNTTTRQYEFRKSISFLVAWRGVPEIKTQYKKEGETITW